MNSVKVAFFILLGVVPFPAHAMNDEQGKFENETRYTINLSGHGEGNSHASSSDDTSLREILTPRECDQETYERFAKAVSLDDHQMFMEIVLDIGTGDAVLSDASIVKLIILADTQNKKFYADVLRDAQEILNRAYGEF